MKIPESKFQISDSRYWILDSLSWIPDSKAKYSFPVPCFSFLVLVTFVNSAIAVEPRFNEVPRDWEDLFAISRVRYIWHLHLTNFRENYQNVRYIEVKLVIDLQTPAFPDLKKYCNRISVPSYTELRH